MSGKARLEEAEPKGKLDKICGVQWNPSQESRGVDNKNSQLGTEGLHQNGSGNPNLKDHVTLLSWRAGRCQRQEQRLGTQLAQSMSIHSTIFIEDLLCATAVLGTVDTAIKGNRRSLPA